MARKRSADDDYARKGGARDKQAERGRARSLIGRDVGPLPEVVDPGRRRRASKNLKTFCNSYLRERFFLRWSNDHLSALLKLQTCALKGGLFAFAMPRGSGKSSLCEATAIWALLYGHRRFVLLVSATETAAQEMLASAQTTLESNDLLAEDFPETCYPVRCLQGISHRANGQLLNGERTRITWTNKEIVLPTVANSLSSGSILRVAGLTGRVRGHRATNIAGEILRPDLALVDDPQTDESARSPEQNNKRERYIGAAVGGMSGPKKRLAIVMPMTVIAPGDIADRFLDRERYPQWQGERSKLMPAFPVNLPLWEEYARLRKDGMKDDGDRGAATAHYRANREKMDEGAVISWPERYLPGQLSAIEYAMCLWIDNPQAFASEYQNAPEAEGAEADLPDLQPDLVAAKLNRVPRGTAPRSVTHLVCGIDVQSNILYWLVTGWREDFGGGVVDYGAWPRQNRAYFAASDARPSLADQYPKLPESAAIYAGLADLVNLLAERAWPQEDSEAPTRLERIVIDANYAGPGGTCKDAVYQFCRQSPHRALLLPSHGRGITARNLPMAEMPKKEGQRKGRDWVITSAGSGPGRHVWFDANSWKSFIAERLRAAEGEAASLFLPGSKPYEHQLLADHLCAEHRVATEGRGRTLEEWVDRPDRRENHWWDGLVLTAVAASVQGLVWAPPGAPTIATEPRKRVKLSELYAQKAGGRS